MRKRLNSAVFNWPVKSSSYSRMLASCGLLLCWSAAWGARLTDNPNKPTVKDYTLGSGDVLTVTVADAPEFGGKFRVSDSGTIQLPKVTSPVLAEGKTATELAQEIAQVLIDAKQLRDPEVSVFVDEFHGRTITVLGAVAKPGTYSLQKKTSLLEAVTAAGGALPNSGATLTIVRGEASAEATHSPVGSVEIVDMARYAKNGGTAPNIEVRNGDAISVSAVQVIYVVGAVVKPGGFTMASPEEGISVAQAVALAQGFTSIAATHRTLIVRRSVNDSARREITVDVAKILAGQEPDVLLAPNDILYVPNSGAKQTAKVLGEVAMAAVNGLAIYGLGYKVGTSY